MVAAVRARFIFAASLVVAGATAQACLLTRPETVTLVASADHPEDHACATYMESLMRGTPADLDELLEPLRHTERYREVRRGAWPGFPAGDLDLALVPDRFAFAMPVEPRDGFHLLTRADQFRAS